MDEPCVRFALELGVRAFAASRHWKPSVTILTQSERGGGFSSPLSFIKDSGILPPQRFDGFYWVPMPRWCLSLRGWWIFTPRKHRVFTVDGFLSMYMWYLSENLDVFVFNLGIFFSLGLKDFHAPFFPLVFLKKIFPLG